MHVPVMLSFRVVEGNDRLSELRSLTPGGIPSQELIGGLRACRTLTWGAVFVKAGSFLPRGTFRMTTSIVSPKFSAPHYLKYSWIKKYGANIPRILDVPGHTGILIHPGMHDKVSRGCLLPCRSYSFLKEGEHWRGARIALYDTVNSYYDIYDAIGDARDAFIMRV